MKMVILMNIVELTNGIIQKIVGLYPNIDVEALKSKVSEMKIVESEIGEKSPFIFDQNTNTTKLNSSELSNGKYDLEYYMTVTLLMMTKKYEPNLQGLRTGYFAGVASNLVGNYTSENEADVEPGIDLYESLRVGVADLSSKVGALNASNLCESESLEEFIALASELGVKNPKQFLAPYNYLALNFANLTEPQIDGLVSDMEKGNQGLNLELSNVKTI